uniref:BTB domain-containing protein n=1 Tax=Branchiostoma floridae TaxID=7739 RepID=C3Z4F6_BRAFL|eukprot:XP_002596533.1 hypothetical protein BRAFLDRAFT_96425 [Branchiostoma floridae]
MAAADQETHTIAVRPRCYQDESYLHGFLGTVGDLQKTGVLQDVVLEVEGQRFPCHRLVLSAASPVGRPFEALDMVTLPEHESEWEGCPALRRYHTPDGSSSPAESQTPARAASVLVVPDTTSLAVGGAEVSSVCALLFNTRFHSRSDFGSRGEAAFRCETKSRGEAAFLWETKQDSRFDLGSRGEAAFLCETKKDSRFDLGSRGEAAFLCETKSRGEAAFLWETKQDSRFDLGSRGEAAFLCETKKDSRFDLGSRGEAAFLCETKSRGEAAFLCETKQDSRFDLRSRGEAAFLCETKQDSRFDLGSRGEAAFLCETKYSSRFGLGVESHAVQGAIPGSTSGRGVSYTPVLNQVQFLRARSDFRSRSEVVFKTGSVLGSTLDRGVNNADLLLPLNDESSK